MSADDYGTHILQKYLVGTAIAVLKSKPKGMSTENYISSLREKITMTNNNLDVDDEQFDVLSDDFAFSEDEDMEITKIYDIIANVDNVDNEMGKFTKEDPYVVKNNSGIQENTEMIDIRNKNGEMDNIANCTETIDDVDTINDKSTTTKAVSYTVGRKYGLGNTDETIGWTNIERNTVILGNQNVNIGANLDIRNVDNDLIVIDNDEDNSLNDSVNILENFDVNMIKDKQSLSEVLGVLRDINQNKTQNEIIDLTQSQIRTTYEAETINIFNPKIHVNESFKSNELKENKIERLDAQNLPKRIRKTIETEKKTNKDSSITKYVNKNDSIYKHNTVIKDTNCTKDTNAIHYTTRKVNTTTILDNRIERASIREDLAAKVLKNISTAVSKTTHQHKCKETDEFNYGRTADTTDKTDVVPSSLDSLDRDIITQTDLDKTNFNDSKVEFRNVELCLTQNQTVNNCIAKKILNNINKNNAKDQFNNRTNDSKVSTNILEGNKDTQETILYSLPGLTQNYTHISQSQNEQFIISDKFIYGNKELVRNDRNIPCKQMLASKMDLVDNSEVNNGGITVNNNTKISLIQNNQIHEVNSQNFEYIIDNDGRMFKILPENTKETHKTFTGFDNNERSEVFDKDLKNSTERTHKVTENIAVSQETDYFDDIFEKPSQILQVIQGHSNIKQADTCNKKSNQNTKLSTQDISLSQDIAQNPDFATQNLDRNDSLTQTTDTEDEVDGNEKDVIPFKVLEEFNKVKVFLNKTDRCTSADGNTTDSGYRSNDSQSRSSYKSGFQLSGNSNNWLNQSAHCIYSFIVQCPLAANTEDICNEISVVLGRLIDRLHDNEIYPSFIEDLFETVNSLLEDLYEGNYDCDNMLQKKDENIRRLLLVNRSQHLLKYTLEKVTEILEKSHKNLTSEDVYEIDNIQKVENLSYVFFVLEKLIQRYVSTKKYSSVSNTYSQNSQNTDSQNTEEKILKRSSLTEIWKKKWNPGFKNQKMDVCMENVWNLAKLSEVLNKIIVECMEGYSLVAYAALQCFNMLQN